MIKKLSAIAVMLLISLTSYAQLAKFSAGVKGVGVANFMDTDLMTYGGGGGAFASVRIANIVGLQAEAVYSYTFGRDKYSISDNWYTIDMKHNHLHVPVLVQVWCGRSVALEAGYQQTIVLGGKLVASDFKSGKEDKGMFDYGSVVAGFHLNLGKVVTMNLRYAYGLGCSYIATNQPLKSQSVQFGLGFRFFTTRKTIFK